jgi:uncharacterized protein
MALAMSVALLGMLLIGCAPEYNMPRLRIATGNAGGVYNKLGTALANAWQDQLDIEMPDIQASRGSPDNLDRLLSGQADVAFSAADVLTEHPAGPRQPRALARIYDDYLHVVVRADTNITRLTDLSGHRVSIGSADSGVAVIADRLLTVSGLRDVAVERFGLTPSLEALQAKTIDAFFWSGGLPTQSIKDLAEQMPLRLLDLSDVLPEMRKAYPIYGSALVPASTYELPDGPVTTLVVPNFLLVTDQMPDDVAEALTRGLFDARPALVNAAAAAMSIDVRSAIETSPIPLHPGAARFYRDNKI